MAAVLMKIPYKSRKRVNLRSSKKLNISSSKEEDKPKRRIVDGRCHDIDDKSSPPKIKNGCNQADFQEEQTTASTPLTSREDEIKFLEDFLTKNLENEDSASLYISGQPGTGKTACLSYILQIPKFQQGYKQVYVNCTMMKSASSIYKTICKELQLKPSGNSEKTCLNVIEKYLKSRNKMTLLVLDEIDQLDSKRQSVLYSIFEWPAMEGSRIVLIGVANALDLTERTLPRLQTRCSIRPQTLHFPPYTKDQIIKIFTNVLANEDKTHFFSPVALQMLAAKIAAVSGDMRRALDIGRRVVEVAKRSKFSENKSVSSMLQHSSVTVELKEVLEVLNDVYGGSKKMEDDVEDGIPMQQKLILCSMMLMITKGKNTAIVMGKLHDVYKRVTMSRNITPLELTEMAGACALLEARGAVRLAGTGGVRARKLRLAWDTEELAAALKDKPLLSAILADTSCFSS